MTIAIRHRRFSVHDYCRLAEVGILGADERTELIEGEIIEMAPIGPAHSSSVDRLTYVFSRCFGDGVIVRVQGPLQLDEWSLPQPDLVLLQHRADFYSHRQPRPEDALLVVEVSDASVRFDRRTKVPLYARSGVAEVWLLALGEDRVEVYRTPVEGRYAEHVILRRGERISVAALPRTSLPVDDLLG